MAVGGREHGKVKPWTQDNRLLPWRADSVAWRWPGPAPHYYLIIFCSSDIATIVLGEEVETELCLGITDWTPAHSLLGDTAPGHA